MARNRRRKGSKPVRGICKLCGEFRELSFEHVPPQKAYNSERSKHVKLEDWLARDSLDHVDGGRVMQGGIGRFAFCGPCNSFTGSKYASEYTRWAHAAVSVLQTEPLGWFVERQLSLRTRTLEIDDASPLRFVKQVVTMALATSPEEFGSRNQALRDFVLDERKTGLPSGIAVYANMFRARTSRLTGVAGAFGTSTGELHVSTEVTHFPFATAISLAEASPLLERGAITHFADVPLSQRKPVRVPMLVGFGHTPFPNDLRSRARVEFDSRLSDSVSDAKQRRAA